MSNTVNLLVVAAPPVTASLVAFITEASPVEYGLVGLILTVGLIPIVRWMMRRMDVAQKAEIEASKIRADKDEAHLIQLTKLVGNIETLNKNHQAFYSNVSDKLDEIHSKVVRLNPRGFK